MPQDIASEEYTYSGARGNASARVSVSVSDESDTQTFRKYLESSEIDLHFQNNVEILALVEQIDRMNEEIAHFGNSSNFEMEGAWVADQRAQNLRDDYDDFVANIERQIEAEIAKVKAEFHDLAEALTRGRTDYEAAVAIVGRGFRPSMAQITGEFPDITGETPDLTGPELRAAGTVENYELFLKQYELIKQGYAHNTSMEIVGALTKEVTIGLVEDALLLGAGKALRIGKLIHAIKMSRPAQAIAVRYSRLTQPARDALERVRARVRGPDRPTKGPHGETIEGPAPKRAQDSCPGFYCFP